MKRFNQYLFLVFLSIPIPSGVASTDLRKQQPGGGSADLPCQFALTTDSYLRALGALPASFFNMLAVTHAIYSPDQQVEMSLRNISDQDALVVESLIGQDNFQDRLAVGLTGTQPPRKFRKPDSLQALRSGIALFMSRMNGAMPSTIELFTASQSLRRYIVQIYFESHNQDATSPTYARIAMRLKNELDIKLDQGSWPAHRGDKRSFQEFVDNVLSVTGPDLEEFHAAILFALLGDFIDKNHDILELSPEQVFSRVSVFNRQDQVPPNDSSFNLSFLFSVITGYQLHSGDFILRSLIAQAERKATLAAETERDKLRRAKIHADNVSKRAAAQLASLRPIPDSDVSHRTSAQLPTPSDVREPLAQPPKSAANLLLITADAQKEIAALRPYLKMELDEFLEFAMQGPGPMQLELRKRQGRWQLKRLAGIGKNYYSVRLNDAYRVGFLIEPSGHNGPLFVKIIAVSKSFTH